MKVFLISCFLSVAPVHAENFRQAGQEIIQIVRDNFYEPKQAADWASAHENYAVTVKDRREFTRLTNKLLEELKTSHTRYYTPLDPDYYTLLAIFQAPLKLSKVEHESIGADIANLPEGYFVRWVFPGSSADSAGLKRGDHVIKANREPFDPYLSFKGKAGQKVTLLVERAKGHPLIEVVVTPRRKHPKEELLEFQKQSSKVIERNGKKIAYANLWSCAGEEHQEVLQDAIIDSFQQADALILDFRNGWGGCNPEFLNLFNPYVPVFTAVNHRTGKREGIDTQWRKPLFVLINKGTRSGKELVVFAMKKHKVGTLIGEWTAGAFMAGKPFLLSDKSLLYLAVKDAVVNDVRLEGAGVEPDIFIPDSFLYAEGKDAQLERALDLASGH